MRGELLVYRPGLPDPALSCALDHAPGLEELRGYLDGGWLDAVPGFNTIERGGVFRRCVAFCDEEGKLKARQPNWTATRLWDRALPAGLYRKDGHLIDLLVGPVVVVIGDDELLAAL